jgi:predicted RNA-binding protein with PUA-like domain
MSVFLLKTEPSTYSYEDLEREKRAVWDGISNPVALRNLGSVKKGDDLLIYHTGDVKAVVGLARAASDAYPDPKAKSAKVFVVDIEPHRPLARPVTLATFREDAVLKTADFIRQPRLSVAPISAAQLARVLELAGG